MKIKNIQNRPDLNFVCNSQDVNFIKDNIGLNAEIFDAFFVKQIDGDYTEIFGIFGIVPYLEKELYQII